MPLHLNAFHLIPLLWGIQFPLFFPMKIFVQLPNNLLYEIVGATDNLLELKPVDEKANYQRLSFSKFFGAFSRALRGDDD